MKRWTAAFAFLLVAAASRADAATIVEFTGNTFGTQASGTFSITLSDDLTSFTGTLTNTSPNDARITAFGFDLAPGNLNGFSGSPNAITSPEGMAFNFADGNVGNVPQFNDAELDFAYLTGKNFNGGSPNAGLDNFQQLSFTISGDFAGMDASEIAAALFVRAQQVGANGQLSDVATPTVVPEPGSMLLLGSGLAYLARRRLRARNT
jgi:hypothetical protein